MNTTNITTAAAPLSILTSTATRNTTLKTLIIAFIVTIIGMLKLRQTSTLKRVSKGLPLPPGPTPWPILGNIPETLLFKPTFRWIHQMMKEMNTDIACIRLANTNIIPVLCPEIAREMLKKQDANFADRPFSVSTHALSGGYMTAVVVPYNEQWKKMKKILVSEILCPARHKWLHEKRAEESDNLVFYVHNQYKNNKDVDLRIATRHYCGNVARKMMFGRRYFGEQMKDGGPGPDEIKHVNAVFTALKYIYSFCVSDYLPFLRGLDLDGQEKIAKDANKTLRDYQNPIIDERYQLWRTGQRKQMEDLLDVLITLKDNDGKPLLTPDEIKNQAAELMTATVDNPSNAVEWAMAELINQPKLLRKATEEIDRVVGKDRLVQESDIANLNYVKACARESFRLHPVAAFNVPHVAIRDTTVAGYFIPKGSHALLSRYGLGRNPKVWKDPLRYDPERHMNGQDVMLTEHDLRFISFSTGRRGCIASVLGTCMTTVLLARLLQCFDWTPPSGATGNIDLSEAEDELVLVNPLIASAKPRLPLHLYPTSN